MKSTDKDTDVPAAGIAEDKERKAGPTSERLFIGVPIDEATRASIGAHLAGRELPGRVIPPENWHLTLRFLGATTPDQKSALHVQLAAASLGTRFEVRFGGLGAFPRTSRAMVLWMGITDGAEALREIAIRVEHIVRSIGFAAEQRAFTPHLTLSRFRHPTDVQAAVDAIPPFEGAMSVRELVLFHSRLQRGPAKYEAIERYPLASGRP